MGNRNMVVSLSGEAACHGRYGTGDVAAGNNIEGRDARPGRARRRACENGAQCAPLMSSRAVVSTRIRSGRLGRRAGAVGAGGTLFWSPPPVVAAF